jgi:hypothetical protein
MRPEMWAHNHALKNIPAGKSSVVNFAKIFELFIKLFVYEWVEV